MRSFRLSLASWQMLQRLSQQTAVLEFCQDDGRFHFNLRGVRLDLVRPSTIEALNNASLLRRERNVVASYVINEKGITALRDRLPSAELLDDSLPVSQNITIAPSQLPG